MSGEVTITVHSELRFIRCQRPEDGNGFFALSRWSLSGWHCVENGWFRVLMNPPHYLSDSQVFLQVSGLTVFRWAVSIIYALSRNRYSLNGTGANKKEVTEIVLVERLLTRYLSLIREQAYHAAVLAEQRAWGYSKSRYCTNGSQAT